MDDSRTRWSAPEVHEAGLTDWRQVLGRLRARFRTGDFATGLALAREDLLAVLRKLDTNSEILIEI